MIFDFRTTDVRALLSLSKKGRPATELGGADAGLRCLLVWDNLAAGVSCMEACATALTSPLINSDGLWVFSRQECEPAALLRHSCSVSRNSDATRGENADLRPRHWSYPRMRASSTPRPLGEALASLEYRIARSSRAITTGKDQPRPQIGRELVSPWPKKALWCGSGFISSLGSSSKIKGLTDDQGLWRVA
jgi:hypothetical protein